VLPHPLVALALALALALAVGSAVPAAGMTATAAPDTFQLEAQFLGDGAVAPAAIVAVPRGGSATFTFTPHGCQTIASLEVDHVPTTPSPTWTFSDVQADHIVYVVFGAPATTTTLTVDPDQDCLTSQRLVAHVVGGDCGDVAFYAGDTLIGTASLSVDVALLAVAPPLAAGAHVLTAAYSGCDCAAPSVSAPLEYAVRAVSPGGARLWFSGNGAYQGQPVKGTVTVTDTHGRMLDIDGTAVVYDGSAVCTSARLEHGLAQWSAILPVDSHRMRAVLRGNTCVGDLVSNVANVAVVDAPGGQESHVEFTFSPAAPIAGQPITMEATVTPSSATGVVQFFNNSALQFVAEVPIVNGTATATYVQAAPGASMFQALYTGDRAFASSGSPGRTVVVSAGAAPATIALDAEPIPGSGGAGYAIRARVDPPDATGVVEFHDVFGTAGRFVLTDGAARRPFALRTPGRHVVGATYLGNAVYAPVTTTLEVVRESLTAGPVVSSSRNPSRIGEGVTFAAQLAPDDSGSVTFFIDDAPVATAPVVAGLARFSTGWSVRGVHRVRATHSVHPSTGSNVVEQAVSDSTPPALVFKYPPVGIPLVAGESVVLSWCVDYGLPVPPTWLYISRTPMRDWEPVGAVGASDPAAATGELPWTITGPSVDAGTPGDIHSGHMLALDATGTYQDGYTYVPFRIDGTLLLDAPAEAALSDHLALGPPRPNPASGPVTLQLDLPRAGPVEVEILDLQGRVVRRMAHAVRPAGRHAIAWDGATPAGTAPPGVYFVRCTTPQETQTRRVVVTR